MTIAHCIALVAPFVLICAGGATAQTRDVIPSETAPPKLVMLVYQRFSFDKATEGGKALAAAARACADLEVPNSWIVLESVTGDSEVLSFDPFDSFAHTRYQSWRRLEVLLSTTLHRLRFVKGTYS